MVDALKFVLFYYGFVVVQVLGPPLPERPSLLVSFVLSFLHRPFCEPFAFRAAAEMSTYDEIKQQLISSGVVSSGTSMSGMLVLVSAG